MNLIILAWTLIMGTDSIFTIPVKTIEGTPSTLETYKGKVILVVNVASKCGYTRQYAGLQALYEQYKDSGLVIVGVPANNFGGQEPGSEADIKEFCTTKFSVSFPLLSKMSAKGTDQSPLFSYLTSQPNPDFSGEIKWNFEKFLIDRDGNLVRRFRSATEPLNSDLETAIQAIL